MLLARQKLQGRDANRSTWAGFVLFGNPLFRLRWTDGVAAAPLRPGG
jgi:hypothetical protein